MKKSILFIMYFIHKNKLIFPSKNLYFFINFLRLQEIRSCTPYTHFHTPKYFCKIKKSFFIQITTITTHNLLQSGIFLFAFVQRCLRHHHLSGEGEMM